MGKRNHRVITDYIKKNYASIARKETQGSCCGGNSCCGNKEVDIEQLSKTLGYEQTDMDDISKDANLGLGCGNPLSHASIKEGEVVLDLGSGGGFDCFIARRKVGENGRVIGVDMTSEMIDLARSNATRLGFSNVEFREGQIEKLPVADGSIDVIVSNCVINLSLEKQQVFNEAFRVLKPGGRLVVSDVVAIAELPETIQQDIRLIAGCIAGAEQAKVIEQMLTNSGFVRITLAPKETSEEIISSWVPMDDINRYVASFIIQAVKPI
ncbi:arsenite methyltransferase [Pleomorphochaeta sp. DL1XJH-081]|jgi:ubiquinone/menaquinone biosynthesis C-methylase UbiE|uniref:arsenite methyltransferase n=1 Tax=Pleomorphochaeta sp. DL1XJH-081 TaxID=3409690 RepID=UPI003BB6092C